MAIPVLLILAALWAAVLLPPFLRARAERGGGRFADRLGAFGTHRTRSPIARPLGGPLRPVGAAHPYAVGLARGGAMSPLQRRRRDVLVVLGGVALAALVLAVIAQSVPVILFALVALGALVAYCAALVQLKRRRQQRVNRLEQAVKVRYLAPNPTASATAPVLRRTASSR